jgi:hypothetical protein
MQLWTHHPSDFPLDAADLVINPARGIHWQDERRNFRYRERLHALQLLLGTSQFLWCFTTRGGFTRYEESQDLVEWELDIPRSQIITFFSGPVWEDLIWGRSGDWTKLFIEDSAVRPDRDIQALVRVPLPRGVATCHGQMPAVYTEASLKYAVQVMEESRRLPAHIRDAYDIDDGIP